MGGLFVAATYCQYKTANKRAPVRNHPDVANTSNIWRSVRVSVQSCEALSSWEKQRVVHYYGSSPSYDPAGSTWLLTNVLYVLVLSIYTLCWWMRYDTFYTRVFPKRQS